VRISRPSELPVRSLELDDAAKEHVGKRYAIFGTLQWLDKSKEDVTQFLGLQVGSTDDPSNFVILSTDALSEYQKSFVKEHCWLEGSETRTVFLSHQNSMEPR